MRRCGFGEAHKDPDAISVWIPCPIGGRADCAGPFPTRYSITQIFSAHSSVCVRSPHFRLGCRSWQSLSVAQIRVKWAWAPGVGAHSKRYPRGSPSQGPGP